MINSVGSENFPITSEDTTFFSKLWDKTPEILAEYLPDAIEILDNIVESLSFSQYKTMREDLLVLLRLTEYSLSQEKRSSSSPVINRIDLEIIVGTIEVLLFTLDSGIYEAKENYKEE